MHVTIFLCKLSFMIYDIIVKQIIELCMNLPLGLGVRASVDSITESSVCACVCEVKLKTSGI